MKNDPDEKYYLEQWHAHYQQHNYNRGLSAWFLRKSHEWAEKTFGTDTQFSKVLEVGAGSGEHINYLRHHYCEYWMSDLDARHLKERVLTLPVSKQKKIHIQSEDATKLTFADNHFNRLIAAHVLEHLTEPYNVLREWHRVVIPGGIITLILPCDPGLSWRIGRHLGPRERFTQANVDYDYWMAREHVNPINNLIAYIRYYFSDIREYWRPFYLDSIDLNLFYICHIRVEK